MSLLGRRIGNYEIEDKIGPANDDMMIMQPSLE